MVSDSKPQAVALVPAPDEYSSGDMTGRPGMYRTFRALNLRTRQVEEVTDVACPGCGTVWMLKEGLHIRAGTLYDEEGELAHLDPYCCGWSGTLLRGSFVSD